MKTKCSIPVASQDCGPVGHYLETIFAHPGSPSPEVSWVRVSSKSDQLYCREKKNLIWDATRDATFWSKSEKFQRLARGSPPGGPRGAPRGGFWRAMSDGYFPYLRALLGRLISELWPKTFKNGFSPGSSPSLGQRACNLAWAPHLTWSRTPPSLGSNRQSLL